MIYDWECPQCGAVRTVVAKMADRNNPEYCEGTKKAPHDTSAMARIITAPPLVFGDIEPYKAATGDVALKGETPVITSRAAHRAFLKRNGLIEVGNEKPRPTRQMRPIARTRKDREELKREIAQQVHKHWVP